MRANKAVLILIAAATMAAGADRKISKAFDKMSPLTMVDVIIQFKANSKTTKLASVLSQGGKLQRNFAKALEGAQFTMPVALVRLLALDNDITYISENRKVGGHMEFANPAVNAQIAYNYGWTGAGIGVAVLDSGVTSGTNTHSDLKGAGGQGTARVVYSESFVPNESATVDAWGHGEHVAGIIAGNASKSSSTQDTKKFRGIAPQVNIVNLKVLDKTGSGSDSSVIAAIDRAIALKDQYNIRVMNLSIGRPVTESYRFDPLCQAVERAWSAGIVVVVAAGNEGRNNSANTHGYGMISSPGNDPFVITVGAMRDMGTESRADDLLASYSSKGPTAIDHLAKPDLVAPGNQIISVMPVGGAGIMTLDSSTVVPATYYKNGANSSTASSYMRLSGTSMAAPMVSGAAALMLQKTPSLTPDKVKAILMKTATKTFPTYSTYTDSITGQVYTIHYDVFSVGAGYLDVWAALNNTTVIPTTSRAFSPLVMFSSTGPKMSFVSPIAGTNVIWGGDDNWDGNDVWGTFVIAGTNVIWGGDGEDWGSGPGANSVLWGENVIWGGDEGDGTGANSVVRGDK